MQRVSAPDIARVTGALRVTSCGKALSLAVERLSVRLRMALVPYDGGSVAALAKLHQPCAQFRLAGRSLRISQDWSRLGVAAVVWDAAVVLCMYLELGHMPLQGVRAIELGAGTGLVGIVAALLGAQVTITDRQPAMGLLRSNVVANLPPDLQGAATVSELTWGEGLHRYEAGGYELVLGADIVYLEETFPALLATLEHLGAARGVVLLSCRLRYERDHAFLGLLRHRFSVTEVFHDAPTDVRVYRAERRGRAEPEL
ncbi:protein N-lysine methyltransferase METTL21A [Amia ocellicauda]|uniref:protein N-lysine methyltransferase METTL21A n=1 Tax=Amia ocellicauda TaxID=2972642 RepID=UPI003463864C